MKQKMTGELKSGIMACEEKPVDSGLEQERAELLAKVFDIMVSMPIEEFIKLLSEVSNNELCI